MIPRRSSAITDQNPHSMESLSGLPTASRSLSSLGPAYPWKSRCAEPSAAVWTGTISEAISDPDFEPCASRRQEAATPWGGITALRKYCSSMPANCAAGASKTGFFAPIATRSTLLFAAAQIVRAGTLLCGLRNPPFGSSA